MFIKKIKKKDLNTDKNYFVFQLFEEVEVRGQKKFKMILSLGAKLNIPEAQHQMLADCIDKVRKQKAYDEYLPIIQDLAENFAKQLLARQHARRPRAKVNRAKKSTSFKNLDLFLEKQDMEPKKRGLSLAKKGLNLSKKQNKSKKQKISFFKKLK